MVSVPFYFYFQNAHSLQRFSYYSSSSKYDNSELMVSYFYMHLDIANLGCHVFQSNFMSTLCKYLTSIILNDLQLCSQTRAFGITRSIKFLLSSRRQFKWLGSDSQSSSFHDVKTKNNMPQYSFREYMKIKFNKKKKKPLILELPIERMATTKTPTSSPHKRAR